MNKGVINLYRFREIALAANKRYLDALSVVENPAPAYHQIEKITEPVVKAGRSYMGFNLANGPDVKLFGAVLDDDHVVYDSFRTAVTTLGVFGGIIMEEDRDDGQWATG